MIYNDNFRFDISRAGFSRRDSMLTLVLEDGETESGDTARQVTLRRGITHYGGTNPFLKESTQFYIRPVSDGKDIEFTSSASPSVLYISGGGGHIKICFDGPDTLRILCDGISLRFYTHIDGDESACPRGDGTVQINFSTEGEFILYPLSGSVQSQYIPHGTGTKCVYDCVPGLGHASEFILRSGALGIPRSVPDSTFDECALNTQEDWAKWQMIYPDVPSEFRYVRDLASYTIWQSSVGHRGIITDPFIFFVKVRHTGGLCWQQAYHAMAALNDIDAAISFLHSAFQFQDPFGQLPDSINDVHAQYSVTKPPFQGYVLIKLFEHWGDKITRQHCQRLYPGLVKWINWWLTFRDSDRNGIPEFFNGCETGVDKNEALSGGVPAESPDLMAYCILCFEALAKMARLMDKDDEAAAWDAKAKDMLSALVREFWNGQRFTSRVAGGQPIEYDELEAFLPLMLGKRLPEDILKKMTDALRDPEKYYTPYGFRTYPKSYIGERQIPGFIGVFAQFKLFPALIELGELDLARDALYGFLKRSNESYPNFGIMEFNDPEFNRGGAATVLPGTHITSLGSAIFIYLAWLWGETFGNDKSKGGDL